MEPPTEIELVSTGDLKGEPAFEFGNLAAMELARRAMRFPPLR